MSQLTDLPPAMLSPASVRGALRKAGTAAVVVIRSMQEGLAAMDRYDALRARGLPHAVAVQQAFALLPRQDEEQP